MTVEDNKQQSFFRFEDLRIYDKAVSFATWIADLAKRATNPLEIHFFKLFSEEAFSIALNIAEGSSHNRAGFAEQLKLAKSNIRKCVVFATIANNSNYITPEENEEIRTNTTEMTKMVGALISSLLKTNSNKETVDDTYEF